MCYYANVISFPLNIGGTSLQQLADVDSDYVRADDSGRGAGGGVRNAGDERIADAVSSGFQRGAICAGVEGPIFPLHQSARPEIRFGGDESVSGRVCGRTECLRLKRESRIRRG